jgi:hypothetical protein
MPLRSARSEFFGAAGRGVGRAGVAGRVAARTVVAGAGAPPTVWMLGTATAVVVAVGVVRTGATGRAGTGTIFKYRCPRSGLGILVGDPSFSESRSSLSLVL